MTLLMQSDKPKDSENNLITRLLDNSRWQQSIRKRYERQWLLNVAFFAGIQHGNWDILFGIIGTDKFKQIANPKYTANHIVSFVLRRIAQLASSPPGWNVIAKTADIKDTLAAKVGEDLLNHLYHTLNLKTIIADIAFWVVTCGTGFARVKFNPVGGKSKVFYFDPATEEPIPALMLTPDQRSVLAELGYAQRIWDGEVQVQAVSPFQVFAPPVNSEDDIPWMVQTSLVPADLIYDTYGRAIGDYVLSSQGGAKKAIWMQALSKLQGIVGPIGGWVFGPDDEDLVWVRELWYRPGERFPNGKYQIEANGILIRDDDNPLIHMGINFPLIKFDYIRSGGKFWGKSLVEDLIWPQKHYNDSSQIRMENTKIMSRPKWLVPDKANVKKITNAPGEIIHYDPRFGKPEPVKLPVADQNVEIIADRAIKDLQDISSQQDVTQAKVPPNLKSGIAIKFLQERDETILAPIMANFENKIAKLGKMVLLHVAFYWENDQILHLWGKDKFLDIMPFKELALRDAFDVVIPAGSMGPRSKSAQAQNALELAQLGLIDYQDPITRKRILETFEMGNLDSLLESELADIRRAEKENEIFMDVNTPRQTWPAVEDFDDHAIHLKIHNLLRKSDVYEILPADNKIFFDEHCKMHEEALQAIMQQQIMMAEAMKGIPGEKGMPSQPKE